MGPTETTLLKAIEDQGCIHLALIDPEKGIGPLPATLKELEKLGTAAIMVGGSTVHSTKEMDDTVKAIKKSSSLPVILFPNSLSGVSRFADAIFFMSLLNSSDPEYIVRIQASGAPIVRQFNLEAIPLGYIVVGEKKTAVSRIGQVDVIQYSEPDRARAYALAAQYFGMRWVYLEAGSGADKPVTTELLQRVVESVEVPVIVGGGIRQPQQALELAKAGAKVIVTGTVLEREGVQRVRKIVDALSRV